MKYLFPLLALGLTALSLLTVVRAPDWMWAWKLSILAGEYGHWLALLPLLLAMANAARKVGEDRTLTLALCAIAFVGLLRPMFTSRQLAEKLPEELTAAFPGKGSDRPVIELSEMFSRGTTPPAAMTTEVFASPDGQNLKLDFYAPRRGPVEKQAGKSAPRGVPCIIVIHGGGWDGGDRTQLAGWNARWATKGYAVAAVSYRLAPRWIWPAQRDDVMSAIAYLKTNAARLGIDSSRFVILGRSAGGQLATAVGYGARDRSIRGVIALYAPHDMPFVWSVSRDDDALNSVKLMKQYMGGPPTEANRPAYLAASGQWLARADSPPTLLVHGELDTLSWNRHSERLAARLSELHVRHYYLKLPWATHGFDFNPDGPGGQLASYAIDRFLAVVLQ